MPDPHRDRTRLMPVPTAPVAAPAEHDATQPRGPAPRLGVQAQLVVAATMWLIGASILLVRGAGYVQGRSWHAWALAAGLVLGVLKSRYLLERVATKAVARIRERGPAFFLSFFSVRSWALVGVMMGSGMALRRIVVAPDQIGAGILGAIYLGVGSALFLADRVFWHAAFRKGHASATRAPAE
ncbi:MAG: hypothetical protein ISP10_05860 [Aeromicrobium sp.]|nr:hypothetical protein [Aeromicrobium sp.]